MDHGVPQIASHSAAQRHITGMLRCNLGAWQAGTVRASLRMHINQLEAVMELRDILISALLAYDRRQATRAGYNRHAIALYLERLDDVMGDIQRGAPIRDAIVAGFNGRLAQALLKATGQTAYTETDARGSGIYSPVTKANA